MAQKRYRLINKKNKMEFVA